MTLLFANDPGAVIPWLGLIVILLAVWAIARRFEVRLTLALAALALGFLAGDPWAIVKKFFATFADEKFVVPICCAMGFAYVLKHTGCDQHLVHLLVRPLARVRFLLIPGTLLVGFLVNMPIISQTSTAVTIGPVVIPILLAARISPVTIGATIVLGCSVGGELLNPGAPELRTVIVESQKATQRLGMDYSIDKNLVIARVLPLDMVVLLVSGGVFWFLAHRYEKKLAAESMNHEPPERETATPAEDFVINPIKAMVPLLPLVFLYLSGPPLNLVSIPFHTLEDLTPETAPPGRFESRLIGLAMLFGVVVAGLVVWRKGLEVARTFFEGAGYGFTHIISLIVTASCFGEGIKLVGLAQLLGGLIQDVPELLLPMAGFLTLGFGILSGSGMASTQSLFGFFVEPAIRLGIDPAHVGAVVSLAAAAGRTMSPVAAVVLMTATLTNTDPLVLVRRVAVPLLIGTSVMIVVAMLLAPGI